MWFKIQDQQVKRQIVAKPNARKTAFLKIDAQMNILLDLNSIRNNIINLFFNHADRFQPCFY